MTEQDARRPDLVALPDSTLSIHSCDEFDDDSEVRGLGKVLIVELKKGGSRIGGAEVQQGLAYATELRRKAAVGAQTEVTVYVLGAEVDPFVSDLETDGKRTVVRPTTYSGLIRRAHARTFHLDQKLRALTQAFQPDPEVEAVLESPLLQAAAPAVP